MGVENIKIEAMQVFYGLDTKQIERVTLRAGIVKADLAAKYLTTYATTNPVAPALPVISKHVFWFKVSGLDVAPALTDAILHMVDISGVGIDTIPEIADALSDEIGLVAGVYANASSSFNVVTFGHVVVGYAPAAHDALVALKQTSFGFEVTTQGDKEENLGCIDGDIEVAFEESFIDVKCHAEGTTPVAQLKNGVNSVEVTLTMQDTSSQKMRKMLTKSGGSYIPDGGTELFGMGTYKNFSNMFNYATKLRLHPARLLAGDRSGDYTFHKAIPNLTGLTFSGENVFKLPLTFKVYPAEGIDSRVNYFSIGDSSNL